MSEIRWGSIDVGALAEKFAPAVVADALQDFYARAVRAEAALRDADELIAECWQQWAYDGKTGKWAGGLSTLEGIAAYLEGAKLRALSPSPEEPT